MFSSSFESSAVSGAGEDDDLVADQRVELAGALGAGLGQAADQLRRGAHRVVGAAGVDPLRREGEVEVAAGGEAGLLEDRQQALARRARVGGRLEHDELLGLEDLREGRGRVEQVGEVGLARAGQRRRHADDDRFAGGEVGLVGGRPQALRRAAQGLRRRRPRCGCARRSAPRPCAGRCRGRPPRAPPRQRRRRAAGRRSRDPRCRSSSPQCRPPRAAVGRRGQGWEIGCGAGWTWIDRCPTLECVDSPPTSNPGQATSGSEELPRAYFVRSPARATAGGDAAGRRREGLRGDDRRRRDRGRRRLAGELRRDVRDKEACFLEAYDAVFDVARRPCRQRFRGRCG